MNKKIIFFCPSIEEGGVEKNLFLMVNKLSENNDISVVSANSDKRKMFVKNVKFYCSKILNLNKSPRIIKSLYCSSILLMRFFNKKNTILIAYESNIFAIILSKILGIPVIVRSNASPIGYLDNAFKKYIFRFFFNSANLVLVNSKEFKIKIDTILKIKSKILYNSIIEENLLKKLSNQKIPKFNLKKKTYKIVIIGRLVDQKDHITSLKALNLLKNKINFYTIVIGKGELMTNLKKFCKNNKLENKIKFLGYKKNIYPYLKWSNALVLSSKFEGSPNVLIESISMNKITISSNCSTGPKEILTNGKGGYLFRTSDYKDLAKKIKISYFEKKITSQKKTFAKKTIDRFSIEKNSKKLIQYINYLK
tara:strand:- start:3392 stop:4486 length:1095 start_codon:yes stop_codon:yes gene_type:complete